MASDAIGWVVGDFFPFGDLISDVWLLWSLPSEKTDDYDCSTVDYNRMRLLLVVGTSIDAIPEVALLLAIAAGLFVLLIFGPAHFSTGRNKEELREIAAALWRCARCVCCCS